MVSGVAQTRRQLLGQCRSKYLWRIGRKPSSHQWIAKVVAASASLLPIATCIISGSPRAPRHRSPAPRRRGSLIPCLIPASPSRGCLTPRLSPRALRGGAPTRPAAWTSFRCDRDPFRPRPRSYHAQRYPSPAPRMPPRHAERHGGYLRTLHLDSLRAATANIEK